MSQSINNFGRNFESGVKIKIPRNLKTFFLAHKLLRLQMFTMIMKNHQLNLTKRTVIVN